MNKPAPFRQADVKRLIKGAQDCGLTVYGVECLPDGKVRLLTTPPANDDLSPLEAWEREHGDDAA